MADGIRTSEEWFWISYEAGLAPMALRLAVEDIEGFSLCVMEEHGPPVLQVPIMPATYMCVARADNASDDSLDELRWNVWCSPDKEMVGAAVTTEDAIDLIATDLNEAKADG